MTTFWRRQTQSGGNYPPQPSGAPGVPFWPQTLAPRTVVGRSADSTGPTEAIPFATLFTDIDGSLAIEFDGHTSTTPGPITYNSIVGNLETNIAQGGSSGGLPPASAQQRTFYVGTNLSGSGGQTAEIAIDGMFYLGDTSSSTSDKIALAIVARKTSGSNTNGFFGAIDASVIINAGVTTLEAIAVEAEACVSSTATVSDRYCYKAHSIDLGVAGNAGNGSRNDTAFVINCEALAAPFVNLFKLTQHNEGTSTCIFPIKSTGKLFSTDIAGTIATGFDFTNITVTGNILTHSSVNLSGTGRLGLGTTVPAAPNIIAATAASAGTVLIQASANGTSGLDGIDIATSLGTNEISIYVWEPSNTGTIFGLTNGNYTSITSAGSASNGLLIGTATADPMIFGANNARLMTLFSSGGLSYNNATDPGAAAASFTSTFTVTSANSSAFAVGRLGATTPAFLIDASTATSITGIKIKSAAASGGVALSAIGETNIALTIDASGSGTITLGGTSTGAIIHTRATTLSAALTYGGVALSNAVTGTGNMVLSSAPTLSSPVVGTQTQGDNSTKGASTAYVDALYKPYYMAYSASTQTPSLATYTKVNYDTDSGLSGATAIDTSNHRITPTVAGTYMVTASADLSSTLTAAASYYYIKLRKNAATDIGVQGHFAPAVAGSPEFTAQISALVNFNGSTDYIEAFGYIAAGTSPTIGTAGQTTTVIQAYRLGP